MEKTKEEQKPSKTKRGRKPFLYKKAYEVLLEASKRQWKEAGGKMPPKEDIVYFPMQELLGATRKDGKKFTRRQARDALKKLESDGRIETVLFRHKIERVGKVKPGDEIKYVVLNPGKSEPKPEPIDVQQPPKKKEPPQETKLPTERPEETTKGKVWEVAMVIDYENVATALKEFNKEFPVGIITEIGRRYGILQPPRLFIPPHRANELSPFIGTEYDVKVCLQNKEAGEDTVDNEIDKAVDEIVKHYEVKTIIIVSKDKDFDKAIERIKSHKKTDVRVKVDGQGNLRVNDEVIVLPEKLSEKQNITETLPQAPSPSWKTPRYKEYLQFLRDIRDKKVSAEDERLSLIRGLVKALEYVASMLEDPEFQRGKMGLKHLLWQSIYPIVRKSSPSLSFSHCEGAVEALITIGVIRFNKKEKEGPKYWVYNKEHFLKLPEK